MTEELTTTGLDILSPSTTAMSIPSPTNDDTNDADGNINGVEDNIVAENNANGKAAFDFGDDGIAKTAENNDNSDDEDFNAFEDAQQDAQNNSDETEDNLLNGDVDNTGKTAEDSGDKLEEAEDDAANSKDDNIATESSSSSNGFVTPVSLDEEETAEKNENTDETNIAMNNSMDDFGTFGAAATDGDGELSLPSPTSLLSEQPAALFSTNDNATTSAADVNKTNNDGSLGIMNSKDKEQDKKEDVFGAFDKFQEADTTTLDDGKNNNAEDVPVEENSPVLKEKEEVPPSSTVEAKGENGHDNDFGVFEAGEPMTNTDVPPLDSTAGEKVVEQAELNDKGNDGSDFGTFNDAVEPTSIDLPVESAEEKPAAEQAEEGAEGNDDDIGDFGPPNNAADLNSTDTPTVESAAETPVAEEAEKETEGNDDGDFGDFGTFNNAAEPVSIDTPTAASSAETPVTEEAKKEMKANDDDDFGTFNDAAEAPSNGTPTFESTAETLVVDESGKETEENDDDNFGDFGTFNDAAEPISNDTPTVESVAKTPVAEEGEKETEGNDDDDFGDFGAFNDAAEPITTDTPTAAESAVETSVAEEGGKENEEDDDDFGDFGTFNGGSEPISTDIPTVESTVENPAAGQVEKETEGNDDDDFGDFGTFTEASTPATVSQTAPVDSSVEQPKADDDGFGGFGTFDEAPADPDASDNNEEKTTSESKKEEAVENADDDDDDFGDFGTFNEAGQSPDSKTNAEDKSKEQLPEGNEQGDDNDEFGDFGDFNSFDEAPAAPAREPAPRAVEVDPFLQKADKVFRHVFRRYSPETLGDRFKADDNASVLAPISIRSIMPSVAADEPEKESSHWSEEQLKKLMTEVEKLGKEPPITIVSDEIPYPYSHYSIPIGGHGQIGKGLTLDSINKATNRPSVPDVLRIDLPSGVEDMEYAFSEGDQTPKAQLSSPTDTNATNFDDFASATSPHNNSGKVESSKDNGHIATTNGDKLDSCKQFLAQIPDLSFMLKSTLCLPEKSVEGNSWSKQSNHGSENGGFNRF